MFSFFFTNRKRYGYIAAEKMALYECGIKHLLITFDNPKHFLL